MWNYNNIPSRFNRNRYYIVVCSGWIKLWHSVIVSDLFSISVQNVKLIGSTILCVFFLRLYVTFLGKKCRARSKGAIFIANPFWLVLQYGNFSIVLKLKGKLQIMDENIHKAENKMAGFKCIQNINFSTISMWWIFHNVLITFQQFIIEN